MRATRAHEAITDCTGHTGRRKHGYRRGRRLTQAARDTARLSGLTTRTYRCPLCGWWHVTTSDTYEA